MLFNPFRSIRAHLPRGYPPLVEDRAAHVVGQIGERDFGFGALLSAGEHEYQTGGLSL
jgi:hypothetical protein